MLAHYAAGDGAEPDRPSNARGVLVRQRRQQSDRLLTTLGRRWDQTAAGRGRIVEAGRGTRGTSTRGTGTRRTAMDQPPPRVC
jgi:hypothetical protein